MDKGGGVCKMSTLVHSRGEGVKIGQNLVHVVVECPLIINTLVICSKEFFRQPIEKEGTAV